MGQMSQNEINVGLFEEVKRLKQEVATLKGIDVVICPHCNHKHENWQDFTGFDDLIQDFDLDCEACQKWFEVHADFSPRFTTKMKV